MQRKTRAQSSFEYLFIVGLALLLIVPGAAIVYQYSARATDEVTNSQIFKVGSTLTEAALLMYTIGDDSFKTIEFSLPSAIHSLTVYNSSTLSEVVINYGEIGGGSDGVFFSEITLLNDTATTCETGCHVAIHPGINKIKVTSKNGEIRFTPIQ